MLIPMRNIHFISLICKTGEVQTIDVDGSPLKNIDYFSIGKNSIAYNDWEKELLK